MPTDTDALSLFPHGNTGTQFIDDARDFVPWNAGILNSGPGAFLRQHVAVANTAGVHLDAHLSCTRLGKLALDDLEIASRLGNLRHFHCRCHKSSYEFSAIVNPALRKLLLARPGFRVEGWQRRTLTGTGSSLFQRRLATTPKRRQRSSADREHRPK